MNALEAKGNSEGIVAILVSSEQIDWFSHYYSKEPPLNKWLVPFPTIFVTVSFITLRSIEGNNYNLYSHYYYTSFLRIKVSSAWNHTVWFCLGQPICPFSVLMYRLRSCFFAMVSEPFCALGSVAQLCYASVLWSGRSVIGPQNLVCKHRRTADYWSERGPISVAYYYINHCLPLSWKWANWSSLIPFRCSKMTEVYSPNTLKTFSNTKTNRCAEFP